MSKFLQWVGTVLLAGVMLAALVFGAKIAYDYAFNGKVPAFASKASLATNIAVKVVNEFPVAATAPAVKTVKTVKISESGVVTVILDGAEIAWTPVTFTDLRSWKLPLIKNEQGRPGLVRGMNKGVQPFYIQVPDDLRANWRLRLVDDADAQKLGEYGGIVVENPGTVWVLEFIEEVPPVIEPAVPTPVDTPPVAEPAVPAPVDTPVVEEPAEPSIVVTGKEVE